MNFFDSVDEDVLMILLWEIELGHVWGFQELRWEHTKIKDVLNGFTMIWVTNVELPMRCFENDVWYLYLIIFSYWVWENWIWECWVNV